MPAAVKLTLLLIGCMLVFVAPSAVGSFYLNLANVQVIKTLADSSHLHLAEIQDIPGDRWDGVTGSFERALLWGNKRANIVTARFLFLTGHWEESGKLMAASDQHVDPVFLSQGLPQAYAVQAVIEAQQLNSDAVENNCVLALAASSGQWTNRLPSAITESMAQFCAEQAKGERMPRVHYWLGELARSRDKWHTAIVEYDVALDSTSFRIHYPAQAAKARYFIAREAERNGSLRQAVELYEQTIVEDPRLFSAYERLAILYRQNESWSARIEELNKKLSQMQPEFTVNQQIGSWVFVGFDIDNEEAIGLGGRFILTLYWYPASGASSEVLPVGSGWFHFGGAWIEVREGINLVYNSGFEWDRLGLGIPFGYGGLYGCEYYANHSVVLRDRLGEQTKVSALINNSRCDASSITSEKISVKPGKIYLLSGWVDGEPGANAGLGYICFQENGKPLVEDYIVRGVGGTYPAGAWNRFSKVIQGSPDSYSCEVVANNYQTMKGTAFFDNLIFTEIGYPGQ